MQFCLRDNSKNCIILSRNKNAKNKTKMEEKTIDNDDAKNAEKIQALRDMISTAEATLQGAKSMLLQLEGKKKSGRRRKLEESDDDRVVEGTFDGQVMLGTDGKQYPVPANYASKSKLVKGDMMKLTITSDGSFIYKQIGPVARRMSIGTVNQDIDGNYFVTADGKPYRVLLASVTYFRVEPGDEVTLVTPKDIDSEWGAIENLLQKSREKISHRSDNIGGFHRIEDVLGNDKPAEKKPEPAPEQELEQPQAAAQADASAVVDEWMPNLEELRKELESKTNE